MAVDFAGDRFGSERKPLDLNQFFETQAQRDLVRQQELTKRTINRSGVPQAFESTREQGFLPPQLRLDQIGDILSRGVGNIGDLIQRPGGLSPGVAEAINPRLASESEILAQNFRNIRGEQMGAAARSGAPLSLKGAIDAALNTAQERAQRGIRREAMSESEQLRRQDMQQTFQLLDTILQFLQSGRGQATAGRQLDLQAGAAKDQSNAAKLAALASIFGAVASASRFKTDFVPITSEGVLDAVRALPVYRWRYKGDSTPHMGPMAEDFKAAFGLGDSPDYIHIVDAVGTLLASTQALANKVDRLEARA